MNTNIMYEALGKARDMFKLYAELHRAKGTVDSDAKAKVNEDMVAIMNEALSVHPDALPELPPSQAFSLTRSVYTADDMYAYARAAIASRDAEIAKLRQGEPVAWANAAEWLRNHYQDHPTIDGLCSAMRAASPPPAQPAPANENDWTEIDLWAEIHRLRAAVKGPEGYDSWQDAATAERIRRVKAEAAQPAQAVTDDMVNRFLGWPLPKDFSPDCGISFDGRKDDEWNKNNTWPIGTNLLTAYQARAMLEHVIGAAQSAQTEPVIETIVALKSDEQASLSPGAYQVLTAAAERVKPPAPGPVAPSINIEAEIAAGTLMIKTLPDVLDFALIGSAMYLRDANDVDFAVLIDPRRNAVEYAMGMHSVGWGQCGDYDGVGGIWTAVRRENLNLMVSHDPKFFADYKTAMEVCKALKLKHKEDRIAVCQIVRDGKKAEDVFTHDGIYGTAQERGV